MRPAYTEYLEQDNDRNRAKLTQFQIDQGKRLNTVTIFVSDIRNLILLTLSNIATIPVDLMLRWLEKKDAEQGGQKNGTPLIFYLLMQDATNPAFVALGELYKSIDRQHGGDLRKILRIWLNQEAPPPPRSMDVELHTSW